jgi:hypothetical protein
MDLDVILKYIAVFLLLLIFMGALSAQLSNICSGPSLPTFGLDRRIELLG